MRGPIPQISMPFVIFPDGCTQNHEFGIIVMIAVAEDLDRAVVSLGDILP